MSVIKFNRNFSELFNWDSDADPTTEQEYQGAVRNWTEVEMDIVDTLLWQPETDYTEENIVKTPSLPLHYVLVCTTGGTSGATEPSYDNVQIGDSVTDGTVEWTVMKLAVGDIPVVSDRAKADASNIGVNAETDNSELWGSAIGGGAVAEDDGKLVTGRTVHAVTSVLASDIADNTDDIAQNATDIGIADKRISNIEKLLQGNLYDYDTDDDTAYTKTVPSGAMPYAGLEKLGGKTVVFNQLVDSGTTEVATVSGHKYYTLIDGTESIVTADGTAITIVDDTADMVCDLTLMFGSGNEPTTVAEFTAQFPASYYPYNAGTLLSAGVTEVVSKKADTTTIATYPIPTAIRNLEGYGWSAGSVYNYVDFEAKKFVKKVVKLRFGTDITIAPNTWYDHDINYNTWAFYYMYNYIGAGNLKNSVTNNLVSDKFTRVSGAYSPDEAYICGSTYTIEPTGYLAFRIPKSAIATPTDGNDLSTKIQTWINANPFEVNVELYTPVETDISAYLTDDNLINVESGGTLTFQNQNGDDYRLPVPSEEEYMIDLQEALS